MNNEIIEEWSVMLLYMLCGGLAFRRFRGAHSVNASQDATSGAWQFWLLLSVGLCLMGINKVADLQTPFIETLKSAAHFARIDGYKPVLRIVLFVLLGGCGLGFATFIFLRFSRQLGSNFGLLLGLSCLALFYLIRTISIVGIALKQNYWLNSWPLEVFSLVAIALFTFKRQSDT